MNKEIVAARIAENQTKLADLKEKRKAIIAQHKDDIQQCLRAKVAEYVKDIESDVVADICGEEIKDIDAQIKRVEEDLEIFTSVQ